MATSPFIFRRNRSFRRGVYFIELRDLNERIGQVFRHGSYWEGWWTCGDEGEPVRICGKGSTRERAAALVFMEHLSYTSRNAIEAMRDMARDWVTYTPEQQTVLMDELQSLHDAAASLAAKIEEHFIR